MDTKELTRNFIICLCVGLIVMVSLFLLLRSDSIKLGVEQPIVTPTPTPTPEPEVVTELVEFIPTTTPYVINYSNELPTTAVDVVVNGRTLFALEDEQTAVQVLSDYMLASSKVEDDQRLIRCYVEQYPVLVKASGSAELMNYGSALAKLTSNPALFPINKVVTTCELTFSQIVVESQQNAQLQSGARFLVTEGASQRWAIYTETVYKSELECQVTETNRFKLGDARSCIIQIGTYTQGGDNATSSEGQQGPAFPTLSLTAPIKGKVCTYFGITNGVMSNGIDYTASNDARVVAPEGGVVIFCGQRGDYGFVVDILHDEGGAVSRLTHLTDVSVELYQRVARGQSIGTLARTESGESCNFHYELIINGIPYNPLQYLG